MRGVRTSWRGGLLGLLLLTVLTVPALAQEGGTFPPGPIYLTEGLVIEAGEQLTIGPGTSLTGSGNISVWGTLIANGTEGSPASFQVQVSVFGGGKVLFRQARLWGVNGTALQVFGGEAILQDVLLESNTQAVHVTGEGRLDAAETVFRDHAGDALYVEEAADVRLEGTTFSGNGRGATVYSARAFHVNDSTFVANGQHLVVDLGPRSLAGSDITLTNNSFRAPAPTPAGLPSIALRYDPALVDESAHQTVLLASNTIQDAPVGIRIEGRGLVVESTDDTLIDNGVGLFVQQATVRLERPTLSKVDDVQGSGRVTLEDARYLASGTATPPASAPRAPWLPWLLGGAAIVLLGGGALALAPRLLRGPPPAPPREPAPLAPAAPAPPAAPDLRAPLTAVERRILEDVLAHPGTPQRAIADRLGYTRQALHYHVKKLEARGLVTKSAEGRETRCEVAPGVASLLGPEPTQTGSHEKA